MDKAYQDYTWWDRPSTESPLDKINLDAISHGLSIVDDRVINNYNAIQDSVKSVAIDETTGLITMYKNDGSSYGFNLATRIYNTIAANQQAAQTKFSQIDTTFSSVQTMLDDMDLKIDITAAGANAGIENLRTVITQNDGYYRQEMTGISQHVDQVESYAGTSAEDLRNYINYVSSSITQTTQAIQLSVQSVTSSVGDVSDALNNAVETLEAQINVIPGEIDLKVSKMEVIDDLTHEFGSGIQITPNRLVFASTGAIVINTQNFILTEEGNARFAGHVDMASGSIDGEPLVTAKDDGSGFNVDHANNAWKLRSAKIDDLGTRYYTYMTKNKNLIVSDSHLSGHNASNDRTDECSIGTKNYPWRKGYFKKLFIQETTPGGKAKTYNVIPEGIELELEASEWTSHSGFYIQTLQVNNMGGNVYLYIATSDQTNLDLVYQHNIDVDTITNNSVTFVAKTQPSVNVELILLAEEFTMARMDHAELSISFEKAFNQLSCWWESPDGGRFISWDSDELVIERYDDTLGDWVEEVVFPLEGEDPFGESQFADNPLIVGSEVN